MNNFDKEFAEIEAKHAAYKAAFDKEFAEIEAKKAAFETTTTELETPAQSNAGSFQHALEFQRVQNQIQETVLFLNSQVMQMHHHGF